MDMAREQGGLLVFAEVGVGWHSSTAPWECPLPACSAWPPPLPAASCQSPCPPAPSGSNTQPPPALPAQHRYYGQSLPLGNASFTNEGLQWLTAEQALADFAALATAVKQQVRLRRA